MHEYFYVFLKDNITTALMKKNKEKFQSSKKRQHESNIYQKHFLIFLTAERIVSSLSSFKRLEKRPYVSNTQIDTGVAFLCGYHKILPQRVSQRSNKFHK